MLQFKKYFESKTFRVALYAVGGALVAALIFHAGVAVGYRKARFSYRWGENYHRMMGRDLLNAHGTFGKIIKVDASSILVQGRDDAEKTILVKEDTVIRRFRETITFGDLQVDDAVVVVGKPNNVGQIEAKLIRVMQKMQDKI